MEATMGPIYHELTPPGIWNFCSHCSSQRDAVNKTPRTPSNQQKYERKSTTGSENEAPFHESQQLPLLSSSSENIDEPKNHLMGCRNGIKGLMAPGRQWNFTIRESSDKHRVPWRHQSMVQCWYVKGGLCCLQQLPGVSSWLASLTHWNKQREQLQTLFFLSLAAGGISVSMFSCVGGKTPLLYWWKVFHSRTWRAPPQQGSQHPL